MLTATIRAHVRTLLRNIIRTTTTSTMPTTRLWVTVCVVRWTSSLAVVIGLDFHRQLSPGPDVIHLLACC